MSIKHLNAFFHPRSIALVGASDAPGSIGAGMLATEVLIEKGRRLARLSTATLAGLNQLLPRGWSRGIPVDLIGDAHGERYRAALEVLRLDPGVDAMLAMHYPTAVVASLVDAVLAESVEPATGRLAIRPNPPELEEEILLPDGRRLLLRPIRPEDEPSLRRAFTKLTPEEIRLRFFGPMSVLDHATAARLTQIDYEREMALVLTDPGCAGVTDIYGVVRLIADADNERAEFAIIVGKPISGLGLGKLMMRRILDYARTRGIGEVFGEVMRENRAMLGLANALGFEQTRHPDDPGTVRVSIRL